MAATNYDACLAFTLKQEGGYTNDPHDPGGATNYGITIIDARKYWKADATPADVKAMPLSVAKDIYKVRYWDMVRGDYLPEGVDLSTFDASVNSGVGRGLKWLKQAQDQASEPKGVIKAMASIRRSFLQGLRTFQYFGKGWMRRVNELEALALVMWSKSIGADGGKVLKDEAQASKGSSGKAKGGIVVAGGSGGAVTTAAHQGASYGHLGDILLVGGLAVATILLVVYLYHQYKVHKDREQVFNEIASKLDQG